MPVYETTKVIKIKAVKSLNWFLVKKQIVPKKFPAKTQRICIPIHLCVFAGK